MITHLLTYQRQFLDEADLLADHIAILAAPGKLIANGSPISLKCDLGEGYSVQVTFNPSNSTERDWVGPPTELLHQIHTIAPSSHVSVSSPLQASYHLKSRDAVTVEKVLQLLDTKTDSFNIASYDVLSTSIEDIFLDLMSKCEQPEELEKVTHDNSTSLSVKPEPAVLQLADSRSISPFRQAFTILHKRVLIARRSWLTPLLTVLIAVAGSTIPLVFISGRTQSCTVVFTKTTNIPLYLPSSTFMLDPSLRLLDSPPGVVSSLGSTTKFLQVTDIVDNATFVGTINQNYRNLPLGGISLDLTSGSSLIAWEATPPGLTGPHMLNLATNILYNHALNSSGHAANMATIIQANYESFPPVDTKTLFALKWMGFFSAVIPFVLTPFFHLLTFLDLIVYGEFQTLQAS